MTCENYEIHNGKFFSEKDYQVFLKKLNQLIEMRLITTVENANINSPFFEDKYICGRCHQKWRLATPDQAFRGGWYAE